MEDTRLLVVIGAQKAGTSFLFQALAGLEGVLGSPWKEPGTLMDGGPSLDFDTYVERTFGGVHKGNGILTEATPEYMLVPGLFEWAPFGSGLARAIVVLRDPLDRIVSQFKMRNARLQESDSLESILKEEIRLVEKAGGLEEWVGKAMEERLFGPGMPDYVLRSAYQVLLPPWRAALGGRMSEFHFEDLVEAPLVVVSTLLEQAGCRIDEVQVPSSPVNPAGNPRSRLIEHLLNVVRWSQRKYDWRIGGWGSRLERLNRSSSTEVHLSSALKDELNGLLRGSIEMTEGLRCG